MTVRVLAVLALAAALSGCAARSANIAQLKVDPARYYARPVQIEGVVTHTSGPPALGSVYKIDDGSGEITVVFLGPVMLTRGARVRVTGTLERQIIDGQSVVLQVQQHSLDVVPAGN